MNTLPEINTQHLLDTFVRLCRISSPARQEGAVAREIREELKELGLEVREDEAGAEVGGEANNLLATAPATVPDAPGLLLCAHMDTVEPNPGVEVVVEEGVVRTDGSAILGADDKAGIAPIIEAVRVVLEQGLPHGPVHLLFTVCEEIGLMGAKHLSFDLADAQMAYVFDSGPPVGSFIVRAPSLMRFRAVVRGRAAHAGVRPEEGISAIEVAAEAIAGMRLGRIDEETTANIGSIEGGRVTNVVCDEVRLKAEARSLDRAKLDAQVAHMRQRLEEAAARRGATVEITTQPSFESYHKTEDELVVRIARSAANRLGMSGELGQAGGGSDANVFNSRGLPSIVVRAGMQKNHTHDEFCTVEDLVNTARLALAIIAEASRHTK
jgi:tripeptide aminopeptidase